MSGKIELLVLYVVVLATVGIALAAWFARSRRHSLALRADNAPINNINNGDQLNRPGVRNRFQQQGVEERNNQQGWVVQGEDESDPDDDEESEDESDLARLDPTQVDRASMVSASSTSMRRAIRKREKREMKEARAAAIRSREERKAETRLVHEEREAKREEERLEREEKAREEQEKREREEAALYSRWKGTISVEQSGSKREEEEDEQSTNAFVERVKTRKIVMLDEIGAEFNLTSQEVVARIQTLETQGLLSGLFDDRGKYIYITEEEMQNLANYITSRGRVSVSQLAIASNQLIKIT